MASDAGHGDRAAYLLRLADTRHRPTRSIQDALEAQVCDGDDLVVASRNRPSMIAANGSAWHHSALPFPALAKRRVDAETPTLDRPSMGFERPSRQQLWKRPRQHGRSCRHSENSPTIWDAPAGCRRRARSAAAHDVQVGAIASRIVAACTNVIIPSRTESSSGMSREARRRIVKLGAATKGGNRPSNRCP
jgi:hypothetical protein